MLASVYIRGEYKRVPLEGYADQTMVSAIWQIEDHRLEEVYGEIMEKYGKQVKRNLQLPYASHLPMWQHQLPIFLQPDGGTTKDCIRNGYADAAQ